MIGHYLFQQMAGQSGATTSWSYDIENRRKGSFIVGRRARHLRASIFHFARGRPWQIISPAAAATATGATAEDDVREKLELE